MADLRSPDLEKNGEGVSLVFIVEKACLPKLGAEITGDKVWVNFNGSATVLDGMGGQGGDFLAARVGGYAINREIEALPKEVKIGESLRTMRTGFVKGGEAIREARKKGKEFAEMDAVGDAVKICSSADKKRLFLLTGHIGDTATFVWRNSSRKLEKVTTDHSLVQGLVKSGQLTEQEAFLHPARNVVTRGIGDVTDINVDEKVDFEVSELHPGDFVLVLSDGITDNLETERLERIIINSPTALEKLKTSDSPSGLAMHLAEIAHGVAVRNNEPQAKPDDISAALIAPVFSQTDSS